MYRNAARYLLAESNTWFACENKWLACDVLCLGSGIIRGVSNYTSGGIREHPFIHAQRLSLHPCMLSEGRFIHVQRISLSENRFMHIHSWQSRHKLVFTALHAS